MSTYEVGSVLWVIHTDRPGLMAYQVIEEITKKTLEGEQIQYLVQSATNKSKTVKLDSIKGLIFEDSEEAKQKMIENATKAIDGMVVKIQHNVDKLFNGKVEETVKSTPVVKATSSKLKPDHQWVVMDDGTKVQVKLPEVLK
tara:strand:+ start:266 stop:691 length:426 start_codon:yes stop_codon:yes gene_type:complete